MSYETLGTNSQLQIIIPRATQEGWAVSIRNNCFQKIVTHDHTGVNGKGVQLTEDAFASDAISGIKIRLDNDQFLRGRNAADSADKNIIKVTTGDELAFGTTIATADFQDDGLTISDNADNTKKIALNASNITTGTTRTLSAPDATGIIVLNDNTATLTNKSIDADTNTITNIENADIKAAAAIAVNKLAATTASRALVSDGSGFISAATTTATEIGYVNGVTSAIQTQLNAKAPSASPTFTGTVTTPVTASRALVTGASNELAVSATTATEIGYVNGVTSAIQTQINSKLPTTITTTGDIIYSSSGTTAARLGIGSAGEVLTVTGGVPSWEPVAVSPTAVTAVTTTYTALTSDEHIEATSGTFTITLYSTSSNSGRKLTLSNTGSGTVTVVPDGVELFHDGTASKKLLPNQVMSVQFNGSDVIITSGRIQPASVSANAATSMNNATSYFVGFGTTDYDTQSRFTNVGSASNTVYTSTTYYTAPITGYFNVSSQIYATSAELDVNEIIDSYIAINGTATWKMGNVQQASIGNPRVSNAINKTIYLAAGDKVSVVAYHEANIAITLNNGAGNSWFEVTFVA